MLDTPAPDTIIETPRLLLRPVTREEALTILRGEVPPTLKYAEGFPSEFSLEAMDLLVGARSGEPVSFTPWFMIRRDTVEAIGGLGWSLPKGPARPVVGYEVIDPLWGQGYATEALQGLLAYLLSQPGVEAVEADTFEDHVSSRRVMEKAGMTHFDTHEAEVDGETRLLVYYEKRR